MIEVTYETYLRYVQGTATLQEARQVRAWLADPTHELVARYWMDSYAALLEQEEAAPDEVHDYVSLLAELHTQLDARAPAVPTHRIGRPWGRWAAAAAAVTVVGVGSWWYQQQALPKTVQYSTTYGQTQVVHLPDGTDVTLNAQSTLRHTGAWTTRGPREVWLDGEAFFSVKHLPNNQHFIVHTTAGFNVEVLGTKFTVYRRHAQARVVLLSGKVKVDFADQLKPAVILRPGELLQTSDKQPQRVVHKLVQKDDDAVWQVNKIVFHDTPLAELATRLRDTYGVEVVVKDSILNQRKLTGTVPTGDLDLLCETLEATFHLQAEHQQQRIILSDLPSYQSTL